MSSPTHPRIPFKGTIFLSVSACAGLWFLSVRAESLTLAHGSKVAAMLSQTAVSDPTAAFEAINLGSPEDLEQQLEQYMPLSGVDLSALQGVELSGGDDDDGESEALSPAILSVEAVRAARPPGWVYPAFDMPAEGMHGPPAAELPRNISFQLTDGSGVPMAYDAIQVFEQTVNGPVEVHPYRCSDDGTEWSFGIRRLMTGATAYFLVETNHEGQRLGGTLMLDDLGTEIDVDAGSLQLAKKAEPAWGSNEQPE